MRENAKFNEDFDLQKAENVFDDVNKKYQELDKGKNLAEGKIEFLREEPPKLDEISASILEAINNAKTNIKIIQPYVTKITKIEDALIAAVERNVDVEIITARK